uniref:Uncharacterized protein n=1 Tax=Opuntia streptacantha TaxID=393608 RepID=A0A7C9DD90_OPUST
MSSSPFGSSFDNPPPDAFDDAAKNISSAAVASIVVGVIATIAIVIAIIYCLKKTGDAIPAYAQAQLTIGANKPNPNQVYARDNPTYLTKATIEQFLSDIAKEKPIRFSPQELTETTNNFSQV